MSEYSNLTKELDDLRENVIDNLKKGQGSGWAMNLIAGSGQKKHVNAAFEKFEDALKKFNGDTDITPKDQQEITRARNTFDQELRGLVGRYVLNTKQEDVKGDLLKQQQEIIKATNAFIQNAPQAEQTQKAESKTKNTPDTKPTEKQTQTSPNTDAISKAVAEIKGNVGGLGASKDFIADKISKLEQNISEFSKGNGSNAQEFFDDTSKLTTQIAALLQTETQTESANNKVENKNIEIEIQKSLATLRNANLGFGMQNQLKLQNATDQHANTQEIKSEINSIKENIQGATHQNTNETDLKKEFSDKAKSPTLSPDSIAELEAERAALNAEKNPVNTTNDQTTYIPSDRSVMTVTIGEDGKDIITPAEVGENLEIVYEDRAEQAPPEYISKLEQGIQQENGTMVKEQTPLLSANDEQYLIEKGDTLGDIVLKTHSNDYQDDMSTQDMLKLCEALKAINPNIDDINKITEGDTISLLSEEQAVAILNGSLEPEQLIASNDETFEQSTPTGNALIMGAKV